MPYLTWVMSKFLNMGFPLEQVVAMATVNPAKIINRLPKLGTLQVGAPGDVSVLELVEGPVEFVDTRDNKRQGKVQLRPGRRRARRASRSAGRISCRSRCGEATATISRAGGAGYFAMCRCAMLVAMVWNVVMIWLADVSRKKYWLELASGGLAQFCSKVDVGSPPVSTCTA